MSSKKVGLRPHCIEVVGSKRAAPATCQVFHETVDRHVCRTRTDRYDEGSRTHERTCLAIFANSSAESLEEETSILAAAIRSSRYAQACMPTEHRHESSAGCQNIPKLADAAGMCHLAPCLPHPELRLHARNAREGTRFQLPPRLQVEADDTREKSAHGPPFFLHRPSCTDALRPTHDTHSAGKTPNADLDKQLSDYKRRQWNTPSHEFSFFLTMTM